MEYVADDNDKKNTVPIPKYSASKDSIDWGFHEYMRLNTAGTPSHPPCPDCTTMYYPSGGGQGGNGGSPYGGLGGPSIGGNGNNGHNGSGSITPGHVNATGASITSTFVSSVGLGGSGYIRDLKTYSGYDPTGGPITPANTPPTAGYVWLYSDLNKGAGGSYGYFLFTRDPSSVKIAPSEMGQPYSSGQNIVTRFETRSTNTPHANYFGIQEIKGFGISDLNDVPGGEYIYAFQSKNPSIGTYFSEVGILIR